MQLRHPTDKTQQELNAMSRDQLLSHANDVAERMERLQLIAKLSTRFLESKGMVGEFQDYINTHIVDDEMKHTEMPVTTTRQ